jgi:hypothetical protein
MAVSVTSRICPPKALLSGFLSFDLVSSAATVGTTYVFRAPVSNSAQHSRPSTFTI